MPSKKFDWLEFSIHAFFGAILGAICGSTLGFFAGFFIDVPLTHFILAFSVLYALVAGIYRDEFWSNFGR